MLQLLYHSMTKLSTPPFKNILMFKETYYFTYLLPYPAAYVPIPSSRSWGTVGHLVWPSGVQLMHSWWRSHLLACVQAKGGHFELW